jgi:spore germination cell wall hydrolase CwlJ-like protein
MQTEASAPAPTPQLSRASGGDLACLAEVIYFEARGTGAAGREAVAHVVVNRAENPEFPDSVCGVVADRCQFSYRCDDHPDILSHEAERAAAFRTAQAVLTGAKDITDGALFFHADRVAPAWFDTRPRIGVFGGNVFYR